MHDFWVASPHNKFREVLLKVMFIHVVKILQALWICEGKFGDVRKFRAGRQIFTERETSYIKDLANILKRFFVLGNLKRGRGRDDQLQTFAGQVIHLSEK